MFSGSTRYLHLVLLKDRMSVMGSNYQKAAMKRRERDPLGPARRMAEFIGDVVSAATISPKGKRKRSAVRCRRRPGHRKCPGRIIVCEQVNGEIEWQCPSCNGMGVIHGWQGGWSDLSELRETGEQPGFEVMLTERRYDELKKCLMMDMEWDDIMYAATYTTEGIILRAGGRDMKAFADYLSKSREHKTTSRRVLTEVLNGIQTVLGRWNPS